MYIILCLTISMKINKLKIKMRFKLENMKLDKDDLGDNTWGIKCLHNEKVYRKVCCINPSKSYSLKNSCAYILKNAK